MDSDSVQLLKINWQQTKLLLLIELGSADEQKYNTKRKYFAMKHTLHWSYELKAASTGDESKSSEENNYRNINALLWKAIKMSILQNGL